MSDSNSSTSADSAPMSGNSSADADVQAFLAEVERAAARLRRLPLSEIVPETPFHPDWPERVG